MTAGITVKLGSAVQPYEQIRAQIAALTAAGTLAPGTRLPTVRSLAADLGIAAGTVARACKELEQSGLLETRRRNGTVVAGIPAAASPAGKLADAQAPGAASIPVIAAVDRFIAEGREAGLDEAALLAILQARLGREDE